LSTDERLDAVEKHVKEVNDGRLANSRQLRNHRAFWILAVFGATIFGLQVERLSWKDGVFDVSLREIRSESIVTALVAASLVADKDVLDVLDRMLRK
jgi:hypothetical protein